MTSTWQQRGPVEKSSTTGANNNELAPGKQTRTAAMLPVQYKTDASAANDSAAAAASPAAPARSILSVLAPAAPAGAVVQCKQVQPSADQQKALELAFLTARLRLSEALANLGLASFNQQRPPHAQIPTNPVQQAAPARIRQFLGNANPQAVVKLLSDVRAQLQLCQVGHRYAFFDGQGNDDAFAGTSTADVLNEGVGDGARICILVPNFFAQSTDRQAHDLIHEASHGAPDAMTRDLAYSHERIFSHLESIGLSPLDNADSVAAATMAAATGNPHHDRPPPTDINQGLAGDQLSAVSAAMGIVGLSARIVDRACERLAVYLQLCQQQRKWVHDDEFEDAEHDAATLQEHGLLAGKDFAGHLVFIHDLMTTATTLSSAGTDPLSFTADPTTSGDPVLWQGNDQRVLVRPHAAQFTADALGELLLRQGLFLLNKKGPLNDQLTGVFKAFLAGEIASPANSDEEVTSEGEDDNEKGHDGARDNGGKDPGGKQEPGATPPTSPTHITQFKAAGEPAAAAGVAPASGGGAPLPAAFRGRMERAYGTDFSAVRVHQDGAAQAMGAEAFTRGSDIHVRSGAGDTSSTGGQELLAHELTHVVQQRAGRVKAEDHAGGVAVNRDPALEREADDHAARAVRGGTVGASSPTGSAQHGDDEPLQALHGMLGLFADKTIHRYGWQAFVIAMGEDNATHVTVFARDNMTNPQWKKLNKAAKQSRVLTLADLPAADLLVFEEFHVTVGGDKHHFYKDTGAIQEHPAHGVNEPFGADSWLVANKMAVKFLATLGVNITLLTLDHEAKVARKRHAGNDFAVETLKTFEIK